MVRDESARHCVRATSAPACGALPLVRRARATGGIGA